MGYWFEAGAVLCVRGYDYAYSYFSFIDKGFMYGEIEDIIKGGQFEIERGELPQELKDKLKEHLI